MDRPRHARKDVRALADWLAGCGWEYDGQDSKGHSIWLWPGTGERITLPESPRGTRWQRVTKAEACKVMGVQLRGKYHRRARVDETLTIAQKHAEERARILAQRDAEFRAARARAEARQRLIDEDRHAHEIEALMRPGFGR